MNNEAHDYYETAKHYAESVALLQGDRILDIKCPIAGPMKNDLLGRRWQEFVDCADLGRVYAWLIGVHLPGAALMFAVRRGSKEVVIRACRVPFGRYSVVIFAYHKARKVNPVSYLLAMAFACFTAPKPLHDFSSLL